MANVQLDLYPFTGGSGAVDSVNGKTGAVELVADDIMATNLQSVQDNLDDLDDRIDDKVEHIAFVTGESPKAYVSGSYGDIGVAVVKGAATGDTIVLRDTQGRIQAADPAVNGDVATKAYVDSHGGGKQLYEHLYHFTTTGTTVDRTYDFNITFVCDQSTAFTAATLRDFVYSNTAQLQAVGTIIEDGHVYTCVAFVKGSASIRTKVQCHYADNGVLVTAQLNASSYTIADSRVRAL